ncbi:MAG: hydantoinase B/oxoprolinase family protein, partial [Actinomycetales bacterium]
CCDRERSVPWGLDGGLASTPQGLWLNPATSQQHYLGAVFSGVELVAGDVFRRSSSGGGGYGDPLLREINAVREDVLDEYVSIDRAAKDYGVVLTPDPDDPDGLRVDLEATERLRSQIRANRLAWLAEDPELVARRFRAGELDVLDCIRQYGVILDWGDGRLLPRTTQQHRELTLRRAAAAWQQPTS